MWKCIVVNVYCLDFMFSFCDRWWITGSMKDQYVLVELYFIISYEVLLFTHLWNSAPQSCGWWWGFQSCRNRWPWRCPLSRTHPGGAQGCCPSSFSTYEIVMESRGMCEWEDGSEWWWIEGRQKDRGREKWIDGGRENSVTVHINKNFKIFLKETLQWIQPDGYLHNLYVFSLTYRLETGNS